MSNVAILGSIFLFLQITYDLSKPINHRIVSVRTRCGICDVPMYRNLEPNRNYRIIIPSFTYNGGDGYDMFKGHNATNLG